jgi:carboxymethylenebutenolidase
MAWTKLTAKDGHELAAWRADAPKARGALVVVQEIFGVNGHIRAVTDRFAAAGYTAIAPALFDRVERGVELGYDEEGFGRGRALAGGLAYDAILADLAAAIDALSSASGAAGKVSAVGYCFGGAVVWVAAARLEGIACAVSYYGSRIVHFKDERPKVPLMMHVGRADASFPLDEVQAIGARHPDVVIHAYDAGHGFNCDARPDFDAPSSALALERTLAFFGEHL